MSRMTWRPARAHGAVLALGALALAGAAPAAAQNVVVRPRVHVQQEDCRCVDKDGKPIERCTCVVMPDVDRIVTTALAGIRGRARLGVTLTSEEPDARGARVASVLEDGPAHKAGIQEGDVITRINGKSLLEPLGPEMEEELDEDAPMAMQRLMALVRGIEPGDDVTVDFLRGTERRTVTLEAEDLDSWTYSFTLPEGHQEEMRLRMGELRDRLGELRIRAPRSQEIRIWSDSTEGPRVFAPGAPGARSFFFRTDERDDVLRTCPHAEGGAWTVFVAGAGCIGGLALVDLNPGLADYFGTSQGVLVANVHEDSKLGLQPGDVILEVGNREATDPERVRRILGSYGAEESVTLRIMRQKREMSVQGTLAR